MAKFKVGDEVEVFAPAGSCFAPGEDRFQPGDCFVIAGFYPDLPIYATDGNRRWVHVSCLRKRPPPEQPADEDFQRDLDKWLNRDREVVA